MSLINLRSIPPHAVQFFQYNYHVVTSKIYTAALFILSLKEHSASFLKTALYDRTHYFLAKIGDTYVACNSAFIKSTLDRPFVRQNGILIAGAIIFALYKVIRIFQKKMYFEREKELEAERKIEQAFIAAQSQFKRSDIAGAIKVVSKIISAAYTQVDLLPIEQQRSIMEIATGIRAVEKVWTEQIIPYLELEATTLRQLQEKVELIEFPEGVKRSPAEVSCLSVQIIDDSIKEIDRILKGLPLEDKSKMWPALASIKSIEFLWDNLMKPSLEAILAEREDLSSFNPCLVQ